MQTPHAVIVWAVSLLTAPAALAQTPPPSTNKAPASVATGPEVKAKEHYASSRSLFAERKYEESITELQRAYALVPSPVLLYNTARCYEHLGDYSKAVEFYQRYLDQAVGAPDAEVVAGLIQHYRTELAKNATPTTPKGRAAALARQGRKNYQAGRYAEAIDDLERANKLEARSAFIYNIAKCHEKLGDYDKAIVYYQRYLEMAPKASDRQDVISLISSLQARMRETLSELSVRTVPTGADVYIDDMDKLRGQTPLDLRLKPGAHKIVFVKNGYETVERKFEMPEDRPRDLAYALVKVKNFGGVSIDCDINGAQIFVDGKILGLTPYGAIKLLEAGTHQITVQRQGYYLYQAEAQVERGRMTWVRAQLPERGQLTGWMTSVGTWIGITSAVVGGATAGLTYWLGNYTVRGTPLSNNLWTAQQVGMFAGLGGVLVGLGLIGADLVIQPDDVYEKVSPSEPLPASLLDPDVDDQDPLAKSIAAPEAGARAVAAPAPEEAQ